jgi:hypothetical protein
MAPTVSSGPAKAGKLLNRTFRPLARCANGDRRATIEKSFTPDYTSEDKDVILKKENGGLSFKFNRGLEAEVCGSADCRQPHCSLL